MNLWGRKCSSHPILLPSQDHLSLYISLNLNCVFYMLDVFKDTVYIVLLVSIQSLCLLIGAFNPLMFKVIIDNYELTAILLIVFLIFCSILLLFFSSFTLFPCNFMTVHSVIFEFYFLLCMHLHLIDFQFVVAMRNSFPGDSDSKESACNARNPGLISGLERCPGKGNGNPLQYSYLENHMNRGSWQATVHGVTNNQTWLNIIFTMRHVCVCVCVS